ncbi:hypothetical protein [Actinospica sp.]|jgi:hypothetical protein|uniref:RNA polymerase sigma factor n=1 Tax=Actinospica sp. TaxID=1872142 RepID=UPI002BC22CD2|nr:hypothetical protein [Actinospica sp.]HWG26459.1 hypothetical protein [Actinospica sp.]
MQGVGLGAAGDRARVEFGAYFADHQREVSMLAYRLCGEPHVAEEITADAFAEAWRCWDELTRAGNPQPEAMRAIVERLVQGRVRTAGPMQVSKGAVEPDGARVRALLAERITLIPSQDAPTVVIARITEPVEPSEPEAPATRFRRPIVLSAVIATGAVVVLGAIAMAASKGSGATHANQSPLSLAATGTIDAGATGSLTTGAAASASPSRSASASPSPSSTSASPTATHSASATPSPTNAATSAAASTGAAGGSASSRATTSDALSASASVNHGSNGSWTQLNVSTSVDQTLSALTITITVADCPGLSAAGAWDSGSGSQFNETTTQNADGSITYVFELASGDEVTPGGITFAAQFSHAYHSWNPSADTYSVTAEVADSNATGSFGGAF